MPSTRAETHRAIASLQRLTELFRHRRRPLAPEPGPTATTWPGADAGAEVGRGDRGCDADMGHRDWLVGREHRLAAVVEAYHGARLPRQRPSHRLGKLRA